MVNEIIVVELVDEAIVSVPMIDSFQNFVLSVWLSGVHSYRLSCLSMV